MTFLTLRRPSFAALLVVVLAAGARPAAAHPLGNFTVNHFVRLRVQKDRIEARYVVDMAEIAAFQELQRADADQDGVASEAEREAYASSAAAGWAEGLVVTVDGARVPLHLLHRRLTTPAGAGGLATLRLECDLAGELPPGNGGTRRGHLSDSNHDGRIGWREIVVTPGEGVGIFDSSAFASGVTDELKAYPGDLLTSPLAERAAEFSFTAGPVPPGAAPLRTREGKAVVPATDRFAALIAVPRLTPLTALLGLLLAFLWGGMHALSPGHGKTVVGAYLVGARGTARHALFLGLTVTATHTAGVFILGLLTLFASRYVLPETLYPVLSFFSGATVVVVGAGLMVQRLRAALGAGQHDHSDHDHAEHHAHPVEDGGRGTEDDGRQTSGLSSSVPRPPSSIRNPQSGEIHSHGGAVHSHLPPGADGSAVTWRSLLALGISGGLLPCPSALVVMLSAVALHRTGYGLLLVTAFSLGLATVLTLIGLLFVYAGRFVPHPRRWQGALRALPVAGAFVVTCAGLGICASALAQGMAAPASGAASTVSAAAVFSLLGIGLGFGLKHALEADHVAAVTTIVSERKSVLSSALVGGLWGIGHTVSLLVAGVAVILFQVRIGGRVEQALEFCVALMLIGLGANALRKLRAGGTLHLHVHEHGGHLHVHPHLHGPEVEEEPHTHHGFRLGARPVLVGMVHGLAGSAALMLLVLAEIPSPPLQFAYIGVFGAGSIGGMMLMSALVGLPVHFTAARFTAANTALRALAGVFSLGFGLFMAWEIGPRLFH